MKFLQSWYIFIFRGVLAIILGILLFTQRAYWNVVQYMGIDWLTTGLTNFAWVRPRRRDIRIARWAIVAGILEIIAGVIAFMRPLLVNYFSSLTIILMQGVLVIITGILLIFGGFRISSAYGS